MMMIRYPLLFATLFAVASAPAASIFETAAQSPNFKTLTAAVRAAGLDRTLSGAGTFTVFAPTDAAFEALGTETLQTLLRPENKTRLTQILTYHVLPNEVLAANVARLRNGARLKTVNGQELAFQSAGPRVGNARLVRTDILCDNGVIHVIDAVLVPANLAPIAPANRGGHSANTDLIRTAQSAGQFRTLLAAIDAADLRSTLLGEGPFTVFAPTDEAFAKLGDTVEDLLRPENRERLRAILTYHVLPQEVLAANVARLRNGSRVRTVNGATVRISNAGTLAVNDARIVQTDVLATNGVIHVIDKVLLPH
jgi:uncharacterized surface protein with fasciclin (FAS1) repeats